MTRTDQTGEDKQAIRRKMKRKRKLINKKKEKIEQIKTGLNRGQMKLLKKNDTLLKKQLKDSKVSRVGFSKSSQFFQNMSKSQTKN